MLIPVLLAATIAAAAPPGSASPVDASRSETEYALARSLVARGLPVSASIYYARIAERGPSDPFHARALQGQLEIADRVDDTALPTAVAADALDQLSPEAAWLYACVKKPHPGELKWQQIPWLVDLGQAIAQAQAENQPLVMFVSGDDPLEKC